MVNLIGMVDHKGQFLAFMSPTKLFEAHRSQFLSILTICLCLQLLQMLRSRDLAIFTPTTTMTMMIDIQTDHFTPCACVRGKNS